MWRETIRSLTDELNKEDANYITLKGKFQIRLNPSSEKNNEDQRIIEPIEDLIMEKDKDEVEKTKTKFNEQISLLLKHDWESVELEANNFSLFP